MSPSGAQPAEPYSPRRRTALLLAGTGTAGAYHAGVLRALDEAGVKIDVAAGCGIGAIGALFAAVGGAQWLWNDKGFRGRVRVGNLYPGRSAVRLAAWGLALALGGAAVP